MYMVFVKNAVAPNRKKKWIARDVVTKD
jgi:hypothetical protein